MLNRTTSPNRDSVLARQIAPEDYFASGLRPAGTFTIVRDETGRKLYAALPGDASACCPLQPECAQGWILTGEDDRPTLTPSILVSGYRGQTKFERWHGWLREGMFVSC